MGVNKLSDDIKKELLPVITIEEVMNSKDELYRNLKLGINDFSNLYNYIGEKQSYSFDLSDLFKLKTDPIDKGSE